MISQQPEHVLVDDAELAYVARGAGDAVVFVHGSVSDFRSWQNQVDAFSDRYRAVAYSRRYHWPNPQPGEATPYVFEQHVADLGTLIETLGLAPARLVGSSYGAMTALALSAARPELVRTLVLGEPPLLPWLANVPEGQALVDAFMASAFVPARQAFARGDAEAGVRSFINGVIGPGAFDRMPAPARQAMLDNAPEMRAETLTPPETLFPRFSPEDVRGLSVPVLLAEGETSPPMFGLITGELARVLPNAERVTIPAASHGMHSQNPGAYNEAVLAFQTAH